MRERMNTTVREINPFSNGCPLNMYIGMCTIVKQIDVIVMAMIGGEISCIYDCITPLNSISSAGDDKKNSIGKANMNPR